jgi:hypothetical protein
MKKTSSFVRKAISVFQVLTLVCVLALVATPPAQAQIAQQGPYGAFFRASTAVNTATLTIDQMFGLLVGTPTAGATYTTPTATVLCNAFPAIAVVAPGTQSTFGLLLVVVNTSGNASGITMAGGSGVTATGTLTIAASDSKLFWLYPTNCTAGSQAWTLYSITAAGAN